MHFRRPSPSLVISLIALVMATSGTAVAAVSYAKNAGKVDGKDASSAGASLKSAAGNVVATAPRGPERGKIPGKFLSDVMRGSADSFARPAEVQDNAGDVPTQIANIPGLGTISASCFDQNARAGVEDPATTITFGNTSGAQVNVSREVRDRQDNAIFVQLPNTTSQFTVGGSNVFRLHIERDGINYVVDGVIRQDGRGTPAGTCIAYGYALRVANVL
jgi:hypothetical protein